MKLLAAIGGFREEARCRNQSRHGQVCGQSRRDCNLGSIFRFCLGVWRFDPGPNPDQSQPQGTSAARAKWGADETVFVEKVMKGKHSGMWESHTPCLLQNQPPESFAGAASL